MRRALVAAIALGLLAPAPAGAKGGVMFDEYPDVQAVGSKMKFTAMLMHGTGVMRPIEGARPLITFRNEATNEVVRVRGTRSDLNGVSYGAVALPSKGPWNTEISVNGRSVMPGDSEPFRVGVGLTQTIPAADARAGGSAAREGHASTGADRGASTGADRGASAGADRGASAWPWIALAALASAAAAFALHRRRRWGAA